MSNSLKPYEGKEPYIFVSYCHKDSPKVFDIISKLQAAGFRIWYDKGIEWGSEWPDDIAKHICDCKLLMAFHSENSKLSQNCKHEIYFSIKNNKDILSVYLEDVKLNPGVEMQLAPFQAIYFYQYQINEQEDFYKKLLRTEILQACQKKNLRNQIYIVQKLIAEIPQRILQRFK